MALTNFVPDIWSRVLNINLRRNLVGQALANTLYQGEIANAGDTVKIQAPAAVTVGTYTPDSDITIQTPTSTTLDLDIDQAKYVAFQIDDVRAVQANVDLMRAYTSEGSYHSARTVDEFIFAQYSDADASNVITKATLSASNIFDKIAEAAENLDVNDVPEDGRWLVISPEEVKYLRTSAEFTAASELGDEVKTRGLVGEVLGFNVFKSNSLTTANDGTDDVRHNMYGHSVGLAFALQHSSMEATRMEKRFSNLVKGLLLYGAKVIKPTAIGDLRAIV